MKYDCEQYEINLDLQILYRDFSFISPVGTSGLFGNLLDNAIEACRAREENRNVEVTLSKKNGFVYIKLANTYGNNVVAEQGAFLSTRRQYSEKGHGMDIIKSIAIRYKGDMNISFDNTYFTITIWLNITE